MEKGTGERREKKENKRTNTGEKRGESREIYKPQYV